MLQTLRIQNFKLFQDLSFGSFKRVNLLTGKNNTGKTGVLEALLVLLEGRDGAAQLPTAFRSSANVGNQDENFWKWCFHNRDTGSPIVLSGKVPEYEDDYAVALRHSGKTPFPRFFNSVGGVGEVYVGVRQQSDVAGHSISVPQTSLSALALAPRPSNPLQDAVEFDRVVIKEGGEERVLALLRKIEPRLKSIRSLQPYGASLLYLDLGLKEKIPAANLGEGFLRLLTIYSQLVGSGKRILLIDEVENGLHYSVLAEIWRGLLHAAEQENVQIFATTHSYECIRAAHAAFAETPDYDFALHRLDEIKGEIKVTTFDKEMLETSFEKHFEIR